jgi:hypothetical protein
MGIAGIQGPLPFPYTEMLIQRERNGDASLKDFLDVFNHRLISILHRIRKQYLISLNACTPEKTEIAVGLRALLGLGQDFSSRSPSCPRPQFIRLCGTLLDSPPFCPWLRVHPPQLFSRARSRGKVCGTLAPPLKRSTNPDWLEGPMAKARAGSRHRHSSLGAKQPLSTPSRPH